MKKIFAYSLIVLCLCSCTIKLSYNFLDWGIQWKVGRLIPLDNTQKKQFKTDINRFHKWHRTTQLTSYADYLANFRDRVKIDRPFTAEEIHKITDDIQALLDIALNHAMPDIERLLTSLDDDQVNFLLKRLDEERQEYREEYIEISEKKRNKIRIKELTYYTRKLFGRLNQKQLDWVKAWAPSLTPYEKLNAQQQILWQSSITSLLERRNDTEGLQEELSNLMFYRTDNWQPELQETMDTNQDLTYALIAKLFNNLTEKQQKRMEKRLAGYAKDLNELAQGK